MCYKGHNNDNALYFLSVFQGSCSSYSWKRKQNIILIIKSSIDEVVIDRERQMDSGFICSHEHWQHLLIVPTGFWLSIFSCAFVEPDGISNVCGVFYSGIVAIGMNVIKMPEWALHAFLTRFVSVMATSYLCRLIGCRGDKVFCCLDNRSDKSNIISMTKGAESPAVRLGIHVERKKMFVLLLFDLTVFFCLSIVVQLNLNVVS